MIISISGHISSGKDSVGKIIQYLISEKRGYVVQEYQLFKDPLGKERFTLIEYLDQIPLSLENNSGWQIKKFSDKLKDMVCILIGCTRKQLEDQTFKATPLGESWNRWKLDTTYVDEVLDSEYWNQDDKTLYFSSKEDAIKFAENEKKQLHIPKDKKKFGNSGDYSYEIKEEQLTPRDILQKLGTEFGRDMIHPDVWINSLFADYHSGIKMSDYIESKWIITDLRFPNELQRIKNLGGICIRVNRKSNILPCVAHEYQHPSETSLDNNEGFNYIINNNGTIEELIEKVKEILIKEKII
jgi:hypothetical protein